MCTSWDQINEINELARQQRSDDNKYTYPEGLLSLDAPIGDGGISLYDVQGFNPWDQVNELLDAGSTDVAEDAPLKRQDFIREEVKDPSSRLQAALSILRSSLDELRQQHGMAFRPGKGKRQRNEKMLLAEWLQGWLDAGVPAEYLCSVTERSASNVAGLTRSKTKKPAKAERVPAPPAEMLRTIREQIHGTGIAARTPYELSLMEGPTSSKAAIPSLGAERDRGRGFRRAAFPRSFRHEQAATRTLEEIGV